MYDPVAWQGNVLVSEPERDAFKALLQLGLRDAFRLFEQAEKSYSWWDYRMMAFRRNMGLRIDHILVSPALAMQLMHHRQSAAQAGTSFRSHAGDCGGRLNKYWLLPLFLAVQPALGGEMPRPDHVVIVIEENRSFTQIIGNREAHYINGLAKRGMLFTQSYGVTHPSQPNYLALFTGTTRGISSDTCPLELSGDNLASVLNAKGLSFTTFRGVHAGTRLRRLHLRRLHAQT